MMSLAFTFWMLVIIFGIMGAMRGWAKELLVTFSVILSLFILSVLGRYVPPIQSFMQATANTSTSFWVRTIVLVLLVFFGYQTPNIPRIAGGRFARERLSDVLLGLVIGLLNGYLIFGTLWFFVHDAGYPFPQVTPPTEDLAILNYLPPQLLGIPVIYFALAVAFLFIIVVFI